MRNFFISIMFLFIAPVSLLYAVEYLNNPAEVKQMLSGHKLDGLYLRTQSAYSLQFNKDGTLINQNDEQGHWWVSEQGQYCRKWDTGRLKGNEACLDLARESDKIAIYSKNKKVAEGKLIPLN
ncbi:MAG: hypothetical protein OEY89_10610 [Gammaproteobacteria bacterium]|nr:hypothetical protein [Gammaproteobacteria bacterium]